MKWWKATPLCKYSCNTLLYMLPSCVGRPFCPPSITQSLFVDIHSFNIFLQFSIFSVLCFEESFCLSWAAVLSPLFFSVFHLFCFLFCREFLLELGRGRFVPPLSLDPWNKWWEAILYCASTLLIETSSTFSSWKLSIFNKRNMFG